jgi:short-subunit dehydrogenase
MNVKLKPLKDQTVVITGATAGIGLATAHRFAAHGARCVLVARDPDALSRLVDEIQRAGGQAQQVVADVGEARQVHEVAQAAIEHFGGFDTWVNNAGASVYGHMIDIPPEDHRRLFDTNFWGVVNGSIEAAQHLHARDSEYGGAIINLGSLVSDRAVPIQGMYSAAKHAVKGFTDALRMELEAAGAPISVSLVKPASIATPFPLNAKNTLSNEPTLPPPYYEPQVVAKAIVHCAQHPKRDIYVGGASKFIALLGHYAPGLTDWIMEATGRRAQQTDRPEHRRRFGLHNPGTGLLQRAPFRSRVNKTSLYTEASMHPVITGATVVGLSLAAVTLLRYGLPRRRRDGNPVPRLRHTKH